MTAPAHDYLSTACWHETHTADPEQAAQLHAYCAGTVGRCGTKQPAVCKWCGAACACRRHEQDPVVTIRVECATTDPHLPHTTTVAGQPPHECPGVAAPPRTWSVVYPPQPGRQVTRVRDDEGDLWHRLNHPDGDAWRADEDPEGRDPADWEELLGFGPLTDATHEPTQETG